MGNQSFKGLLLSALCVPMATAAMSVTAFAQEQESTGVADIVVTAQRREQILQDVPVSVTAITADVLEANRITSARDLDTIVPNLAVRTQPGGSNAPFFSMRGQTAGGVGLGEDRAIATYIDGVYIGSGSGSLFNVSDLQQIEVLRGPQGTLFGRNSSAGAISFITRQPSGEFGVHQTFTAGNYDQFGSTTRVETPEWNGLSALVNYSHFERTGDTRNLGAGAVWDFTRVGGSIFTAPTHLGDEDRDSINAVVKWDISPDVNLVYRFDYGDATGTPQPQVLMFATSIYTAPPPFGCDVNCPAPTGNRPDAVNNIFSLPTTSDVRGHSLTFTANINDYLTFKNITAYRTLHFQTPGFTLDAGGNYSDGSATTGYAVPFRFWNSSEGNDEQFSNETQLILDTDPLTLTTGILYYQMDQTTGGYANASSTIANSGGLISGSNGYYFINVVLPNDNHADAISSAAYAQAEWHFSDQWDLILGTRYTQDRKEFAYFDNALGYMHSTYEGNRPTYMIGLNYSPTDDIMVYAKYSTGYVSGGTTGYRSLTSTPAQFDYDPELSYSQEVGVKADWFDHALRTNLSIFQTDYSGFHIALGGTTLASNGFPQFANAQVVVLNGGDAHSWGGELETTWMTTDHLTLSAGIAYLDFDLTNVNPIYLTVGANVNPLQSQWSGNFAAEYESDPLFGDVRLQARLDASYRSEYYASNSTFGGLAADAVTVDPSWMANARAALTGFRIAGSDAEIALWGRNIFDSDHVTYSTRTSFTATQAMYSGGFDRAPTYGVDLTFDF